MAWAPIISAGIGFLGSLFGGKKKQTTESRVDYKRMVRDAEAAGFNPLTALRNGGAAGFTTTTSTSPGISLGEALVDGAKAGWQHFLDDREIQRQDAQRFDLVQAQLRNYDADTALKWQAYDLAQVRQSTVVTGTGPGSRPASPPNQTPTPEPGERTATNPFKPGAEIDPERPDAAGWEERYGEPGQYPGAYLTVKDDIAHNWRNDPWGTAKSAFNVVGDMSFLKPIAFGWEGLGMPGAGILSANPWPTPEKTAAGDKRRARIERDAKRNAQDLGFTGSW